MVKNLIMRNYNVSSFYSSYFWKNSNKNFVKQKSL